jgi:hypothetical protein
MALMLQDADRDRLVAFLVRRLGLRTTIDGQPAAAMRQGENAAGGGALLAEDAGKALELLAEPALRAQHPDFVDGLVNLLLALGRDGPIPRGIGRSGITLISDEPTDFRITAGPYLFTGNLARGLVVQSLRMGTAAARPAVLHSGNLVEFRLGGGVLALLPASKLGGVPHSVDAEDSIASHGIIREGDDVVLFHESRIKGRRRRGGEEAEVGTLRYEYRILRAHPVLRLTVTFRAAPGVRPRRLRLTTAMDDVSGQAGTPIDTALLGEATGGGLRRLAAQQTTGRMVLGTGGARLLALAGGTGLNRPGVVARMARPGDLVTATSMLHEPGRLHWVLMRHAPTLSAGVATVSEDRLLLAGADWQDMPRIEAMLAHPETLAGRELAPTPAPGLVLKAMAGYLRFAGQGRYGPLPEGRLRQLRDWCDGQVAFWTTALQRDPQGAGLRLPDLAFLAMALEMLDQPALRDTVLDLLLARQMPASPDGGPDGGPAQGGFADPGQQARPDGHAAALLALAQLAGRAPSPRLATALEAGLAALWPAPAAAGPGVAEAPLVASVMPDGGVVTEAVLRSASAGLLLRALRAVDAGFAEQRITLGPAMRKRLPLLLDQTLKLLRRRVRVRDDFLVVSPVPMEAPATVEAQAWVTLAVMDTEPLALAQTTG